MKRLWEFFEILFKSSEPSYCFSDLEIGTIFEARGKGRKLGVFCKLSDTEAVHVKLKYEKKPDTEADIQHVWVPYGELEIVNQYIAHSPNHRAIIIESPTEDSPELIERTLIHLRFKQYKNSAD